MLPLKRWTTNGTVQLSLKVGEIFRPRRSHLSFDALVRSHDGLESEVASITKIE